jgi:hypothetical protein
MVNAAPVGAIALSIRSLPVAAPAPGYDPPPADHGLLARALALSSASAPRSICRRWGSHPVLGEQLEVAFGVDFYILDKSKPIGRMAG